MGNGEWRMGNEETTRTADPPEVLTDLQADCIRSIAAYLARRRRPPTVRELMSDLGNPWPHAVAGLLDRLVVKGWLVRRCKQARGLALAGTSFVPHRRPPLLLLDTPEGWRLADVLVGLEGVR